MMQPLAQEGILRLRWRRQHILAVAVAELEGDGLDLDSPPALGDLSGGTSGTRHNQPKSTEQLYVVEDPLGAIPSAFSVGGTAPCSY